jgi:hypothetical protein
MSSVWGRGAGFDGEEVVVVVVQSGRGAATTLVPRGVTSVALVRCAAKGREGGWGVAGVVVVVVVVVGRADLGLGLERLARGVEGGGAGSGAGAGARGLEEALRFFGFERVGLRSIAFAAAKDAGAGTRAGFALLRRVRVDIVKRGTWRLFSAVSALKARVAREMFLPVNYAAAGVSSLLELGTADEKMSAEWTETFVFR